MGKKKISTRGVLHIQSLYFVFVLHSFFSFVLLAFFLEKHKKISFLFSSSLVALFSLNMLLPQFMFKELSIVSCSIIGRENIEDFFNHVSKHDDIEDKSIVYLAPNYEIAAASLVHLLEAIFASLNPITQQMFLNIHNTEDAEKKDFILETLLNEFGGVALEARKVFDRYKMLGSCVDVISVLEKLEKKQK